MSEGLKSTDEIDTEIKSYRSEMDLVQRWINENCELDSSYFQSSMELFKNLTDYINANKEFAMSNTLFGRNMAKKFERARLNGVMTYKGIRIRKTTMAEGLAMTKIDEENL